MASTSSNKGNFLAILEMQAKHDDVLQQHLATGKKNAQYTSKVVQNEVIEVVGEYIRKENTRDLENDNAFYSIMADEVSDPYSNQEILSVRLRLLTGRPTRVRELFFDFFYLERATGESIAHAITECLSKKHIDISQARGQSYDGAACMSSAKMGVQARIRQLSPRALYVHCNSHVLNLSIASAPSGI
ncbi:zinc finger MYM-type protein 1-like [Mizuhopecten yessoensis]|uniref:zinc finger MYM-type protein 1-like n=1 Tax=Mizuhopecten yessoensis TaxID=6573 RepID=UPI000B459D1C|nr:zinc finger MYM-type protein 1-like [Mizuhopecten yessoensis]